MSKTFRKAMLSTLCMLIVAVMSLTGATYAWFSAAETADITGMEVSVSAASEGFMVSKDGVTWSSTVDFTNDITKGSLVPVSTVDAKNFFTARVNSTSATATSITTTADAGTAEAGNVVELKFYAKNTSATLINVYLANSGIFEDNDETDTKEAYKAARMAVFTKVKDTAGDPTLAYIWSEGENNLGVNGAGTTANCYSTGGIIGSVSGIKTNLGDCKFELPAMVNTTETVIEVTIRLWIEGQDAECTNPNAADSFNVDFDLTINDPTAQQ